MWKIQLFKLDYGRKEYRIVKKVLKSGWITMGKYTSSFEEKFSNMLDKTPCVAVANGTAALHLAMLALDIKEGDEVIIPSLTFVADANVVTMSGAKPVVADVTSFDNWNMSPEDIEKKITKKTKAVIIVHYAGYACDMDKILEICKKHNLYLIEDCAHAPGGSYKGKPLGSLGDISCFSFFTNKNLSVGEGGMVATKNPELLQKVKYLRSHGMTSLTLDRHKGRTISYDVVQAGLNYRIDEMRSALGLVQLKKLEKSNQKRRDLVDYYNKSLKNIDKIKLPFLDLGYENISTGHIYPIMLDKTVNRVDFINKMKEKGIQTSIHYPSMVEFEAYKGILKDNVKIASEISENEITLPLYPKLTKKNISYIVNSIKEILN